MELMKKALTLAFLLIGLPLVGQVINCPSGFSSSGTCGVSNPGAGGQNFQIVAGGGVGVLSGAERHPDWDRASAPAGRASSTRRRSTPRHSPPTFTFVPNGQNIAFVIQNNNNANASGTTDPKSVLVGCRVRGRVLPGVRYFADFREQYLCPGIGRL
jgi:hypothetical protein